MEDKIKAHEKYAEIKHTRDTLKLLQVIKQYMYSNGSEDLHTIRNQVMSTISLFRMRQERGQSVQNFRDQFKAMRAGCKGSTQERRRDKSDTEQNEEYEGLFDDEDFQGIVFAQKDVLCNVQEKAGIPESWILLDSQSTVDVFCNARLLHNIPDVKRQLVLHCNVGTTLVTKKGDLRGYGTVWYHPTGIANILSLNNISKKYRVTYDSGNKDEQGLVVHKEDRSKRIFRPSKKGLYYLDVAQDIGTILVHKVDSNKSKYSIRQYSLAKKADEIQDIIGRPITKDFIKYIEGNMIPNCNITRQDILRAEDIFGPNLRSVKGKTQHGRKYQKIYCKSTGV